MTLTDRSAGQTQFRELSVAMMNIINHGVPVAYIEALVTMQDGTKATVTVQRGRSLPERAE